MHGEALHLALVQNNTLAFAENLRRLGIEVVSTEPEVMLLSLYEKQASCTPQEFIENWLSPAFEMNIVDGGPAIDQLYNYIQGNVADLVIADAIRHYEDEGEAKCELVPTKTPVKSVKSLTSTKVTEWPLPYQWAVAFLLGVGLTYLILKK